MDPAIDILDFAEIENYFNEMHVYMTPELIVGTNLDGSGSLNQTINDQHVGANRLDPGLTNSTLETSVETANDFDNNGSIDDLPPIKKIKDAKYWQQRLRDTRKHRRFENTRIGKLNSKMEAAKEELGEMRGKFLEAEANNQSLKNVLYKISEICKAVALLKPKYDAEGEE